MKTALYEHEADATNSVDVRRADNNHLQRLGAKPGARAADMATLTNLMEDAMRMTHWLVAAILGLLLTGCATMHAAPTPEVWQTLAPTGKLRVGLLLGTPTQAMRDSASGEMKGVGFDLGRELARRMGVPFEPVLYPSIAALLDSGKSGNWDVAFFGFSPARAKDMDFTAPHLEIELGLTGSGALFQPGLDIARPLGVRKNQLSWE